MSTHIIAARAVLVMAALVLAACEPAVRSGPTSTTPQEALSPAPGTPYPAPPSPTALPGTTVYTVPAPDMRASPSKTFVSEPPAPTRTRTPTRTVAPGRTRVWLATPTSAVPRTSTPTSLPTPRLSPEERLELQQELLDTNGDCRLPCWWGIVPGETAWSRAEKFFADLGAQAYTVAVPWNDGATYYHLSAFEFDPDYDLYPIVAVQNGMVHTMAIRGTAPFAESELARDWRIYNLPAVLQTYGKPSRVWVYVNLATACKTDSAPCSLYWLWLFYDSSGFLVSYFWIDDSWSLDSATVPLCPSRHPLAGIDLYLQSTSATRPLESLIDLTGVTHASATDNLADLRPLSAATGWDIKAFYRTYAQAGTTDCMTTPSSLWPKRW